MLRILLSLEEHDTFDYKLVFSFPRSSVSPLRDEAD